MKMLMIIAVVLTFSLSVFAVEECSVHLSISPEGVVTGKTNSADLFSDSAYKDFQVEDDDGFITQMTIFNKLLKEKRPAPQLTVEDGVLLSQAIDRAIAYSTDAKILENPKLKPEDRKNLMKVAKFNQTFREVLNKARSSNYVLSPSFFAQWKIFMEGQRYEHYFTLHGFSGEATKGIINLCGAYPPTIPECCKLKIAELNNVLAMSLCSKNFTDGESVTRVYPASRTKCLTGYKVTYDIKKSSAEERKSIQGSKQ